MTVALIVAAGSGERLGAGRPKALVQLAGRPLVAWSIDALLASSGIERIVIAIPPGADWPQALGPSERVELVDGGTSRSESVRRALDAAGQPQLVLVHDAARPLLTTALVHATLESLARDADADAAIAAVPVTDTVKRVDRTGIVRETLERSELWAVQTPQVFRREALARALAVPAEDLAWATDDAGLIERAGGKVIVVRASDENLKVTTPLDLRVAELLLAGRAEGGGSARAKE